MYPKKDTNGTLVFTDHPEFTPNKTPHEVFMSGAFRGTYFRPIYSSVTLQNYKNVHHTYPFLKDIPENIISLPISSADVSSFIFNSVQRQTNRTCFTCIMFFTNMYLTVIVLY